MRLREDEREQPVVGELSVGFVQNRKTGRPPLREASLIELHGVNGTPRDLLLPLFNASIVSLEGGVLTLTGIELQSVNVDGDMRTSEHVQIWRCTLLAHSDECPSKPTADPTL